MLVARKMEAGIDESRRGARRGSRLEASNRPANSSRKSERDSRSSNAGAKRRYAARVLRRSPGLTLLSIVTMGAGIGVSALLFALVNGIVLRPLPYPESDRLVRIFDLNLRGGHRPAGRGQRQHRRLAAAVLVIRRDRRLLRDGADAQRRDRRRGVDHRAGQRMISSRCCAGAPLLGRAFTRGGDAARAIQSRGGARRRRPCRDAVAWPLAAAFRRRASIVGQTLMLERRPFRIMGVMPDGFAMPDAGCRSGSRGHLGRARDQHYLGAIARLKAGISHRAGGRAAERRRAGARRLEYPATNRGWGVRVLAAGRRNGRRCRDRAVGAAGGRRPGAARGLRQRRAALTLMRGLDRSG